mmetsp:Transcript_31846/g.105436  ORF Transcript_31846/g.105436 Transcript_31846/m.105436 type:complete len:238 (+) Transcript_31846:138-851(+)
MISAELRDGTTAFVVAGRARVENKEGRLTAGENSCAAGAAANALPPVRGWDLAKADGDRWPKGGGPELYLVCGIGRVSHSQQKAPPCHAPATCQFASRYCVNSWRIWLPLHRACLRSGSGCHWMARLVATCNAAPNATTLQDDTDLSSKLLHAAVKDARVIGAQINVELAAELASDGAGPVARVAAAFLHNDRDHCLDALAAQAVVKLKLAVVVVPIGPLPPRLLEIAVRDEAHHRP